jgi:hypothetical protein
MAKKTDMKKEANATGLNSDRPNDVQAIKNLRALSEAVPGCSDLTGTLRWLCENEVPLITEKYKKFNNALMAS